VAGLSLHVVTFRIPLLADDTTVQVNLEMLNEAVGVLFENTTVGAA